MSMIYHITMHDNRAGVLEATRDKCVDLGVDIEYSGEECPWANEAELRLWVASNLSRISSFTSRHHDPQYD